MQKYIFAANTWMSLKTQLLCGFRLFLFKKTVLEFGNTAHFADRGCSLRLFADSLHRTQSADCRFYQIQDYISERPDFFFWCVLLYTASLSGAASVSLKKSTLETLEFTPIGQVQAFLRSRNHWLFWQELMVRDFGTNQGLKSADILCVFQGFQTAELGQKIRQQPPTI